MSFKHVHLQLIFFKFFPTWDTFKTYPYRYVRRKDFFPGGPVGDFPKIFSRRAPKVVKFIFYLRNWKKQRFLA